MASHLILDKAYLTPLEGWRGIAAIFVVLYHLYAFFAESEIVPYAYLGVDFFFILSGFIISRQYEQAIDFRHITIKQFLIRRIARLYPLYIFSILFFLMVNEFYIQPYYDVHYPGEQAVSIPHDPMILWDLFAQGTMMTNLGLMQMPWNGPAWSVSVEWIVNIVFILFIWCIRRYRPFIYMLAIVYCGYDLYQASSQHLNHISADEIGYNLTIARGIMGFCMGALIYRYAHLLQPMPRMVLNTVELAVILCAVLLVNLRANYFFIGVDYLLVVCVFVPVLTLCLYRHSLLGAFASLLPLRGLGKISYSVYLMHLPLGYLYQYSSFFQSWNLPKPWYWMGYLSVLLISSTVTYLLIENPCRRWIRHQAGSNDDKKDAGLLQVQLAKYWQNMKNGLKRHLNEQPAMMKERK